MNIHIPRPKISHVIQQRQKIAKKITKRNKKTEREAQQEAKLMQAKGQ